MPLFGAAFAAPNKGTTILYLFRSPKTLLNLTVNGKIQGLFKAFECFSSTFQGKFYFQGFFKTVLYVVLFKPVRILLLHSSHQCWIESQFFAHWVIFILLLLFWCQLIFFEINFFEKFFREYHHEYHQIVKQFGSRSGPTICWA